MRKNYTSKKTMPDSYKEVDTYVKAADLVGKYEKDAIRVQGIFAHKGKYGMSYALAVESAEDGKYFLNIPAWLGKMMLDDIGSGDYSDYFIGTSIDLIEKISTANGESVAVTFYTPEVE